MSNVLSSAGEWFTQLKAAKRPELVHRSDDPRLGESVTFWHEGTPELWPGRPVLIGFPQDEGVRRNHGRTGAAKAPEAIRCWLYRLTPWNDCQQTDLAGLRLLDMGNVRCDSDLEESQQRLGEVIAAILSAGAVPVVLGGGHETAYGHYLGYVRASRQTAIINLDAHLDVRPLIDGHGHSGSPFRQALQHSTQPLPGDHYVILGVQPQAVSREHLEYVRNKGGVVHWAEDTRTRLEAIFRSECQRLAARSGSVYLTLDSDVVCQADVPGVSAPNPLGLPGQEVAICVAAAGACLAVASFDVVEINPSFDRDGQSARWAATVLWHFLSGLSRRPA